MENEPFLTQLNEHLELVGRQFKLFEPYGPADIDRFYGRTSELAELFNIVTRHNFISVVGRSGVGKSSLVNCGLVKHAKEHLLTWKFITVRHQGNFIKGFRKTLESQVKLLVSKGIAREQDVEKLNIQKGPGDTSTQDIINLIQFLSEGYQCLLLFVFDQFEELFTSRGTNQEKQQEIDTLIKLFSTIEKQVDNKKYKVLVLQRSDYVEYFEYYFRAFPKVLTSKYWVRTIDESSIALFIENTFRDLGVVEYDMDLLLEKLAFEDRAVGKYELPYVNLYIQRLYLKDYKDTFEEQIKSSDKVESKIKIRLEPAEIRAFGNIRSVVKDYFYEVTEELQRKYPIKENRIYKVFRNLITEDGLKKSITYSDSDLIGLFDSVSIGTEIIQDLVNNKILNEVAPRTVELSHDCLAEIINQDKTSKDVFVLEMHLKAAYESFEAPMGRFSYFIGLLGKNPGYARSELALNARLFEETLSDELRIFANRSRKYHWDRLKLKRMGIFAIAMAFTMMIVLIQNEKIRGKNRVIQQNQKHLRLDSLLTVQTHLLGQAFKTSSSDRVLSYRLAQSVCEDFISDGVHFTGVCESARILKQDLMNASNLYPFYIYTQDSMSTALDVDLRFQAVDSTLLIATCDSQIARIYTYDIVDQSMKSTPTYVLQIDAMKFPDGSYITDIAFSTLDSTALEIMYNTLGRSPTLVIWRYNQNHVRDEPAWGDLKLTNTIKRVKKDDETLGRRVWSQIRNSFSTQVNFKQRLLLYRKAFTPEPSIVVIPLAVFDSLSTITATLVKEEYTPEIQSTSGKSKIIDIIDILVHPNRNYFYLLSENNKLHLVKYDSSKNAIVPHYTFPLENDPVSMQLSKGSEKQLMFISSDGKVRMYNDFEQSLVLSKILYTELREPSVEVSQDDRYAVTIGAHKKSNLGYVMQVWDLALFNSTSSESMVDEKIPALLQRVRDKFDSAPNHGSDIQHEH